LRELAPTALLNVSAGSVVFSLESRRQVAEHVRLAEIVHLHTLWNPLNVIVRRECRRLGRPFVLMPHGMLDPYSISVKRWRKALYLWGIERKNVLEAKRLICTTPEEARLARTVIPTAPETTILPLGGDCPDLPRELLASEFRSKFSRTQGRRQILFLGRLHHKKGIDRIMAALPRIVQSCPDVLLTIAGGGSVEFETALRREIEGHDLDANVLLTGALQGNLKWGAYAASEIFVLPSRQENFAISVAEAMHMKIPVVISDKVNTWPYVNEAKAGLVLTERGIANELAGAVSMLLANEQSRKSMGERGREYALQNFTWAKAAEVAAECYREVLAAQ
jgi:glycosyltransferase involved in cell wall biosynthesis